MSRSCIGADVYLRHADGYHGFTQVFEITTQGGWHGLLHSDCPILVGWGMTQQYLLAGSCQLFGYLDGLFDAQVSRGFTGGEIENYVFSGAKGYFLDSVDRGLAIFFRED